jgi:hypothetical protein
LASESTKSSALPYVHMSETMSRVSKTMSRMSDHA